MAKLYFRYGAMNCGKSTAIIQVAYNYEEQNRKIWLMKPSIDTKGDNKVENRSGLKREVDMLVTPDCNILEKVPFFLEEKIDAILVDEAQFLKPKQVDELYEITKLVGIPVLCYGLRCDFRMVGFPGSTRLLEIADDIEELKNICMCGRKATQNLRKENGIPVFTGEQVVIDGAKENTKYEPVCGKCYLELKKERMRKRELK